MCCSVGGEIYLAADRLASSYKNYQPINNNFTRHHGKASQVSHSGNIETSWHYPMTRCSSWMLLTLTDDHHQHQQPPSAPPTPSTPPPQSWWSIFGGGCKNISNISKQLNCNVLNSRGTTINNLTDGQLKWERTLIVTRMLLLYCFWYSIPW